MLVLEWGVIPWSPVRYNCGSWEEGMAMSTLDWEYWSILLAYDKADPPTPSRSCRDDGLQLSQYESQEGKRGLLEEMSTYL